ncbi:adenylate/guanylate cyclase domain-containing protein [Prosthecomicrobium sp. N25]|uniref:adenylate/guanylate cyclase domain-containing protein n=1 Tax=Prosthecomicrobium sp. N25 TaxID=3129254 RepID=UPI003077C7E1
MCPQEHDNERRLVAIFAADVAGYSRLVQGDEVGTLQSLRACRKIVDGLIADHGGRIANTAGDSVLAEFPSAVKAVQCGVDVQEALRSVYQGSNEAGPLQLRIGVHVGDVYIHDGDLLGDGVNIAARLEALADPGAVYISSATYASVRQAFVLGFDDLGAKALKNITEPIHVFRVRLPGSATIPRHSLSNAPNSARIVDKPAIAVLPFSNLGRDPDQDYFAEGITDDIITELSRIRAFLVIARNSTFTYKGRSADVRQVGRELGVQYILEGSVRCIAERLRVNAHLLEACSGNHIWVDRYDRLTSELFDVQDDITRSVVASTQTEVILNEGLLAERRERPELHLWELSTRGWREIYQLTREHLERARETGQSIKRLYPGDPKGPQVIATASYHLVYMGFATNVAETREEAIIEAHEAMRLDDRDEYTQWTFGNVLIGLLGRREEAVAAYKQALEINPNFALAYGSLATTLAWAGQSDEAISAAQTAIRLNPRDPSIFFRYTALALAYYSKGDFQTARDWARHAVARRGNWWIAWVVLAASQARLRDKAGADEALLGLFAVIPGRSISALPFPPLGQLQISNLCEGLKLAGLPD